VGGGLRYGTKLILLDSLLQETNRNMLILS